jgi:hypothetical protein
MQEVHNRLRMRRTRHVALGKERNLYRVLIRYPGVKGPLESLDVGGRFRR